MEILLLISITYTILLQFTSAQDAPSKWIISVLQDNHPEGTVMINYGLYANITLNFTNTDEEPIHCTGNLTLDSTELQIPEGDKGIPFDTKKATEIKTHIGRSFKKESIEGDEFVFKFFASCDQSDSIISKEATAYLTIPQVKHIIQMTQSKAKVSFNLYASYSLTLPEGFLNVDDIEVTFRKAETNSLASLIFNSTIIRFPEPSTQRGFYTIYGIDYIVYPQRFTPLVVNYSDYITIDGVIEFSLDEESIKTVDNNVLGGLAIMNLRNYKEDYSLVVEPIATRVFPVLFSCAVYCADIHLTDEEIKDPVLNEAYPKEKVQFHRQTIDKSVNTQMKFEGLSRYCSLKMKCFVEVNKEKVPEPQNFKSVSWLVGDIYGANIQGTIRLGLREFIETNCGSWVFTNKLNDKKIFTDKAIEYFDQLHNDEISQKEQGCFNYVSRETSSDSSISICLVPLATCTYIPLYDYNDLFKDSIDHLSSSDKISKELQLDVSEYDLQQIIHESDAYRYNNSNIHATLIEQTEEYVSLDVTTTGLPAECFARKIDQVMMSSIFEDDFYEAKLNGNVYQNQTTRFTIPFSEPPKNGEMYTVYMNCQNLPMFDHYHYYHLFALMTLHISDNPYPLPEKEPLPDCKENSAGPVLLPQCKTFNQIYFPGDLEINNIIFDIHYDTFKQLNISQQLVYVSNKAIDQVTFSKNDLEALNMITSYLPLINCLEYPNYTECRRAKTEINHKVLAKILKTYSTIYIDNIPGYDSEREAFRLEYTKALFFLSANYDLFPPEDAKAFMALIFGHIDIFPNVMTKFTTEHKPNVIRIFTTILNTLIDMLHFVEIEGGYESNEKINETTRMVAGSYNAKLKKCIESILNYHKKYETITGFYSNFIYNYFSFCNKGSNIEDKERIVFMDAEATSVIVPSYYLNQLKADYFLVIIYNSFPLLSYNNSLTYSKVVTLKAFNSIDQEIQVKDLPMNMSVIYGLNDNFHWKHCGTFDENKLEITYKDIYTRVSEESKTFVCETTFASDFLLTMNRYNEGVPPLPPTEDEGFKWETWMMIVIGVGIAVCVGLSTGVGCFCLKRRRKLSCQMEMNQNNISMTVLME